MENGDDEGAVEIASNAWLLWVVARDSSAGQRQRRKSVCEAYIDYWMGHKGSTYHDIQMKRVEFLRKLYANAGFSIRPQTRNSKVDLLKQMARTVGASSSEIKEALEALAEPHRIYATPQERKTTRYP